MGTEHATQPASPPPIGTPLFGLDEITDVSAIARDIALVLLCLAATFAVLVILVSVRKVVRRLHEAMNRVDDLIDSVVAARDAISEFRNRVRDRGGMGSDGSNGGFNIVSWLLSPLSHAIRREYRRRKRDGGDKNR